jgi:hypothetical protein
MLLNETAGTGPYHAEKSAIKEFNEGVWYPGGRKHS